MNEQFERTKALLGEEGLNKLNNANVIIFGIGGVGGYVCEALARSGVGNFTLVDHDVISVTNINRQIIATYNTVGNYKVDEMKKRILEINPKAIVEVRKEFFLSETSHTYDFSKYDYVIDCIDTISAKIEIIRKAKEENAEVISSMGTGNKIDPTKFQVADISKTSVCPLARVMRYELKKRNIKDVKVVFSTENPYNINLQDDENNRKSIPASSSFVPPVCGFIIASEVVKSIVNNR